MLFAYMAVGRGVGARGFKMSEGVRIFSTCLVCGGDAGGGGGSGSVPLLSVNKKPTPPINK